LLFFLLLLFWRFGNAQKVISTRGKQEGCKENSGKQGAESIQARRRKERNHERQK
jgi:hypothetical protein